MGHVQEVGSGIAASRAELDAMIARSAVPAVVVCASADTCMTVNDAFIARFGWTRADLAANGMLVWHADAAKAQQFAALLRQRRQLRDFELRARCKSGECRIVRCWADHIEIAGRWHAMLMLGDSPPPCSDSVFARVFAAHPTPQVLIRARDRVFLEVNDAFERVFGYTRDEIVGHVTDEITFYADPLDRERMIASLTALGTVINQELDLLTKRGEVVRVSWSVAMIDVDGEPTLLTVINHIGARNVAEKALRESELRFTTAFMKNPLAGAIVRVSDHKFVSVNDAFVTLFQYSREDLLGRTTDEVNLHATETGRAALHTRLFRDGKLENHEVTLVTKHGERRDVLWSIEFIDIGGEQSALCMMQDITERNRHERALRESEARFASAFMANPLPSAIIRAADRLFVAANDAFVKLFGYAREELVGRCTDDFDFFANSTEKGEAYRRLKRGDKIADLDARLLTKSGENIDVVASAEIVDIDGEPHVLGVYHDVTARNRAAVALRESDERFRQIAENIREVFWLAEPDVSRVHYLSPAFETVYGRPVAELYANPARWVDAVHPADRARVAAAADALAWIGAFEEQYRIVRPDGTVRWVHDRGFPVRDEHGTLIRIAGITEDITERLVLEEEFRQTQKMESLGMLAGGVAHDFNNVLAVIASCNGLLGEDVPQGHPSRELIDDVDAAVNRATGLTRQLLAFSRKQVIEPKVIDLNGVVSETRKMLRRMVGEDVLLEISLDPELGHVRADPGYVVQVLMNLVVNARDAMPRGGTVRLVTRNVEIGDEHLRKHRRAKRGPAVMLAVSDTGCGIGPEVIEHIFEPFFTTKGIGKGTGMGLSVVHGIVDQAGGFIDVESERGDGTTFRIYLPIVDDAVDELSTFAASLAHGTERILVVDDDLHVRRVAARALRARGYNVTEAATGALALQLLASSGCGFDMLLTDVVMPNMDGRELATEASKLCPSLKVLYTSGYTDDSVVRHGVQQGEVDMIEKPFRVDSLARKVRQVLDS